MDMPKSRAVGEHFVWRVFSNLASHASHDKGHVWVSDRTQEIETGLKRRSIRAARTLLEQNGTLVDTGKRKEKGVKVFELVIPGFQFGSGLGITPTEQQANGQVSGQVSGLASGQVSGLGITPQTEQNLNKTQLENETLFDLVVEQQLAFETWRTHTTKEKYKAKVQAQFLPVCAKALRQYAGGHNDPLVASWVLAELFAKSNSAYQISTSALMVLVDKYGLPGSNMRPALDNLPTGEATAAAARAVKEQFAKQCAENRQGKLSN